MNKFLSTLFVILTLLGCGSLRAQMTQGSWDVFPCSGIPKKFIDTSNYLFALSNNSLTGYDKQTGEVLSFNVGYRLNGSQVSKIFYDPQERYLLVVHRNNNIDLLFDDGRTVNVADLLNAVSDLGTVRDACFRDGRAYLAMTRALVVINSRTGLVEQSGIHPELDLKRIVVTDNYIVMSRFDGGGLFVMKREGTMHDIRGNSKWLSGPYLSSYGKGDSFVSSPMFHVEGDKFMLIGGAKQTECKPMLVSITGLGTCNIEYPAPKVANASTEGLSQTTTGFMVSSWSAANYFDNTGKLLESVNLGALTDIKTNNVRVANWDADKLTQLWVCSATGFGLRNTTDGSYLINNMRANGVTGTNVGQICPDGRGNQYFATVGMSGNYAVTLAYSAPFYIDRMNVNGQINNCPTNTTTCKNMYQIAVNPKNPDELAIGTFGGLQRYNTLNGDLTSYNASTGTILPGSPQICGVTFSPEGDLFFVQRAPLANGDYRVFRIKASAWANGAPEDAWESVNVPSTLSAKHYSRCYYSNGYLILPSAWNIALIKVNASDFSQSEVMLHSTETDTDGMSIAGYANQTATIDHDGKLWVGNDQGIFCYNTVGDAFGGQKPIRPKVPRNDGTNLADYLLDKVYVCDIHVDANNQKWVSTIGSGLYRVSADGTEILQQYNTSNSGLPSDNVFATYADPNSNKVYVGTDAGLSVLYSTSSPSAPNFNDVYAYPNPVTPDYTGYITISGLMADSMVKIADSAGNVFFEGQSDGGSVIWDGCTPAGERVKTGIYFVYASHSATGSSQGVVTKIVVVN